MFPTFVLPLALAFGCHCWDSRLFTSWIGAGVHQGLHHGLGIADNTSVPISNVVPNIPATGAISAGIVGAHRGIQQGLHLVGQCFRKVYIMVWLVGFI